PSQTINAFDRCPRHANLRADGVSGLTVTVLGPLQRFLPARPAPGLGLSGFRFLVLLLNRRRQLGQLLRGELPDCVHLIRGEVPADEVPGLNLQPRVMTIPLGDQTTDSELPARPVSVPPIENLSTVDQDWDLDAVSANVLFQSLVVCRRKLGE